MKKQPDMLKQIQKTVDKFNQFVLNFNDTIKLLRAFVPQMPKGRDPYLVLGVGKDADWALKKRVYRAKANYLHPDKGGDAEKFKELQNAWEDVKKREGKGK